MKKNILFLLSILIIASCTTSNEVVSNKLFQKRKYQKGWHINSSSKVKRVEKSEVTEYDEELIAHESVVKNKSETKTNITVEKSDIHQNKAEKSNIEVVLKSNVDKQQTIEEVVENDILTFDVVEKNNGIQKLKKDNKEQSQKKHRTGYSMFWLVLFCFLLPPLAVGMARSVSEKEFFISLLLTVLLWVPGVVYALLIVFDKIR